MAYGEDKVSVVEEGKVVSFHVVDGKFLIELDLNKDGKPLLALSLDIAQVPAEIASVFAKKA